VRPGLIAVGLAVALVGAALIYVLVDPADAPYQSRASTAEIADLAAGSWRTASLPTSASGHATFTFTWYATASARVQLFSMYPCKSSGYCTDVPAIYTVPGGEGATWSATGSAGAMYEVWVEPVATANETLNFSAELNERYAVGDFALPLPGFVVAMTGGGLLLGIGGVALYLGLFLPSGVYGDDEFGPGPAGGLGDEHAPRPGVPP
jgi:hypothetical protein